MHRNRQTDREADTQAIPKDRGKPDREKQTKTQSKIKRQGHIGRQ